MCQDNNYWLAFDEPQQIKGEIICAFHISSIKRNRGFFFITIRDDKYVLVYSVVDVKIFLDLAKQFNDINLKSFDIEAIVNSKEFQESYNENFVKEIQISERIINDYLGKINDLDFDKSNNTIIGLDGFSVDFKRKKEEKEYHCWCYSNDEKYFIILDFVNEILDIADIDKEYRFQKHVDKTP